MKSRGILTLAMGPAAYWQMAINLARSIRLWHTPEELELTIVTDRDRELPADLRGVEVRVLKEGDLGVGFETKLHLDLLAPAQRNLFIDADCLVYSSLDTIFDRLKGRPVATVGGSISEGDWFGDVKKLCVQLGVSSIPKFNGGLYYLEPGQASTTVYQTARQLKTRYDELGLARLRGRTNDELLIASAMGLAGLSAFQDDGSFMSDPQCCPGPMRLNVLTGSNRLVNPPKPSSSHRAWYPFVEVSPAIVHFLGEHTTGYHYRSEAMRLSLVARGAPRLAAQILAALMIQLPGKALVTAKRIGRPVYRYIFGTRPIAISTRQT